MKANSIQVGPGPYAAATDFCKIFENNMDSLYLLSFLLTGNDELAEKCFVQGLQDARDGNRVFRDWAESWSRRTIIVNAIRAVRPSRMSSEGVSPSAGPLTDLPQIRAIFGLTTFERFVYVVCVLEGHSDRECALLFGCTRESVIKARVRALQIVGDAKAMQQQMESISAEKQLRPERSLALPRPALAISA